MTRRTKIFVASGVVLSMVAAAAGGLASGAFAGSKPRHRPTVHTATASSSPATSVSFTFNASVQGLEKAGTISVSGTGAVDFTTDALTASVVLPPALVEPFGGGSSSLTVQVVLSGGTVYAEVPGLSGLLGKPWVAVALPSGVVSAIPGAFSEVGSALDDVGEILSFASGHHAQVMSLGSSTVNGTTATGNVVTVHLKGIGLSAQLWADSSGQLVQASITAGHGAVGATATVDFSGYDAPVTITVPSSSEVASVPLSTVEQFLGPTLAKLHLSKLHLQALGLSALDLGNVHAGNVHPATSHPKHAA